MEALRVDIRGAVGIFMSGLMDCERPMRDTNRKSAIDGRTTRHPGYAVSMRKRKRVEEIFGWLKNVGVMRKTRLRGTQPVGWIFSFSLAAFNLVRCDTCCPQGEFQGRRAPYERISARIAPNVEANTDRSDAIPALKRAQTTRSEMKALESSPIFATC